MRYVVHHRFKGLGACGKQMNIPYGTVLKLKDGFISTEDGRLICTPVSENAHRHFSRDDDGNGLERGRITYAVAFKARNNGRGARFTDREREILSTKWAQFLRPLDVILFNHYFFEAQIDELRKLAKDLRIR